MEELQGRHMNKQYLNIWKVPFCFEGFSCDELEEIESEFSGTVEVVSEYSQPAIETNHVVRVHGIDSEIITYSKQYKNRVRHRGGSKAPKYYQNKEQYENSSQERKIIVLFENNEVALYNSGHSICISTSKNTCLLGDELDHMFLTDVIENLLLVHARNMGWLHCHGSAWIDKNIVNMAIGDSGMGKTTMLLKEVENGCNFFSNDRLFIRYNCLLTLVVGQSEVWI